ncbi:hypothetical protein SAMN05421774_103134 [Gemmobacter megaterium]|uniref:Tetratricopeptide repeat-containing protein n=1 Tax=Gemmobacter megaterium TaxID=1086013 RepID=A0A1N7N5S7_9RHOB|nr:hypothetical protein [Gemmobacter megaterium]GGE13142.1 hypothetical protein GCM10011345_18710 [Gemmobacter megaterium]SIS93491.1 hypothetical protein SAMN05421774_103134 [Gemmobacter megaterium]
MAAAPDGPVGHLPILCRALIQQGRVSEARDIFADTIWAGSFAPEQRVALIAALTYGCTEDDLRTFTARLESIRPSSAAERSRMAAAEVRAGQYPMAIERLCALEREGALTVLQKSQLLKALIQLGQVEAALRRVILWQAQEPDNPAWVLQEAKILFGARCSELAVRCTLAGLERWPLDEGLIRHMADLPATAEEFARAVDIINAARAVEPLPVTAALGLAKAALHVRKTDLAMDVLSGVEAGADLRAAVQMVRTAGAKATIVVFLGIYGKLGTLPLDYVDALLSRHPAHVIYLHDILHAEFLVPAPEIGGSAAGLIALVRGLADDLGGAPLITLGTSSGGFAAMLHGPALGAAGIIAYSGQTIMHSAQERPAEEAQHGGLAYLARIPLAQRDVLPALAACPDLPVWHVAGEGHGNDLLHQRRLAGLPQVRCLIQPGGLATHNTMLPAVLSGRFDALLSEAIARIA